jgi:diguanylate cyclase (GGDEF)-like protein
VLVVDDDEDLRALAEIQLRHRFQVRTVGSGREALEEVQRDAPDVILLDMMMPEMDGATVLERLSSDPSSRDIPVIFLSALGSPTDKARGIEGGAIDYISKPADTDEFIARVAAAARSKARHDDLLSKQDDPVTGLPDRAAFEKRLTQEVARARRLGSDLSILLIDVDAMTAFNVAHGQAAGDRLLNRVAQALTNSLRVSDVVFRYSGDEFAVILPDAEVGTAYLAAERCRREITTSVPAPGTVTCSIAVAELTSGRTPEEVVAKAEIALYRAKESGGDQVWRSDDPRRHGLSTDALAGDLTEREWMVLALLADRRTEQDIAARMGIRPGTVRSHKARIRRKLNVSPELRLGDYVRSNFRDLAGRIGDIEEASKPGTA